MKPILRASIFGLILMVGQAFGGELIGPLFRLINISIGAKMVLAQIVILIIPTVIYFIITKQPVRKTLRINPIGIPDIILILFIGVMIYPAGALIGAIANLFFPNVISEAVNIISGIPLAAKLGIMALTPAICEEITMRGVFLSGFRKLDIKVGALISGLVFGMLHMNFQQFFYAFALGVLLAYLVHITDSIFASMICHFAFNSTSIFLSLLAEKLAQFSKSVPQEAEAITMQQKLIAIAAMGIIALIFTAIAALLMWALIVINKERKSKKAVLQPRGTTEISEPSGDTDINLYGAKPVKDRVLNWAFIATILVFAAGILRDAFLG